MLGFEAVERDRDCQEIMITNAIGLLSLSVESGEVFNNSDQPANT